jgi:hypothetical protein
VNITSAISCLYVTTIEDSVPKISLVITVLTTLPISAITSVNRLILRFSFEAVSRFNRISTSFETS